MHWLLDTIVLWNYFQIVGIVVGYLSSQLSVSGPAAGLTAII
jgi:hypothetical protein